jgi:carbonic anhydrase
MKFLFSMKFQILFVSIIITILAQENDTHEWDYGRFGPDVWSKYFPSCSGHDQSPVNIQTACTIHQEFEPFHFPSIYKEEINFTLQNDGHTITAKHNGPILPLYGGNLNGNYQFVNFHIHWGSNENVGSEHQVYVSIEIIIEIFSLFS